MRTLRGRLTLGVSIVLAGVLLLVGVLASQESDDSARQALDDRLQRTAELSAPTAAAAVAEALPERDRRLDAILEANTTSLRILIGDQSVLETGSRPPIEQTPRIGLRTATSGDDRFRVYAMRLDDENLGGLAVLEVTAPLAGLEERQDRLERRIAVICAIALIVAAALTWFLTLLVLRPLRRLQGLALRIAGDQDLARRMPADDGSAEIRSVAASFNTMLSRLERSAADRERALQATRRFAADAGHELRTPLTSVLATLGSVRRHPGLDPARRDAMLDDALAEHGRLVDLLDGLQALARGDAAPPEHARVDLAELADAAVAAARARHPRTRFAVELPEGALVLGGWENGLRLLLQNLLENAVCHGRPDGKVAVSLVSRDQLAILRVDDDGPGIPPDERERVFDPFVRLDGDRPGSGLGLALVAQQVRHHNGTVELGESPLGGLRVEVRFPL